LIRLRTELQITWKPSNKARLITIVNWPIEQGDVKRPDEKSNLKRTASELQANRHPVVHKNGKNIKNEKNDDDSKARGGSFAGEQPSATGKSSSSLFSNLEEAMKHPRWKEFETYCNSRKGSPHLKGFNTWLPQQAPLKPAAE